MRTAMEVLDPLTPNTQTAMRTIFLRGENSVVYQKRKEKAHDFSRGMNPTRSWGIVSC